jgi:hypothetical protein
VVQRQVLVHPGCGQRRGHSRLRSGPCRLGEEVLATSAPVRRRSSLRDPMRRSWKLVDEDPDGPRWVSALGAVCVAHAHMRASGITVRSQRYTERRSPVRSQEVPHDFANSHERFQHAGCTAQAVHPITPIRQRLADTLMVTSSATRRRPNMAVPGCRLLRGSPGSWAFEPLVSGRGMGQGLRLH